MRTHVVPPDSMSCTWHYIKDGSGIVGKSSMFYVEHVLIVQETKYCHFDYIEFICQYKFILDAFNGNQFFIVVCTGVDVP